MLGVDFFWVWFIPTVVKIWQSFGAIIYSFPSKNRPWRNPYNSNTKRDDCLSYYKTNLFLNENHSWRTPGSKTTTKPPLLWGWLVKQKKIAPVRSITFQSFFPRLFYRRHLKSSLEKTHQILGHIPTPLLNDERCPHHGIHFAWEVVRFFVVLHEKKVTDRSSAGGWWGVSVIHIYHLEKKNRWRSQSHSH